MNWSALCNIVAQTNKDFRSESGWADILLTLLLAALCFPAFWWFAGPDETNKQLLQYALLSVPTGCLVLVTKWIWLLRRNFISWRDRTALSHRGAREKASDAGWLKERLRRYTDARLELIRQWPHVDRELRAHVTGSPSGYHAARNDWLSRLGPIRAEIEIDFPGRFHWPTLDQLSDSTAPQENEEGITNERNLKDYRRYRPYQQAIASLLEEVIQHCHEQIRAREATAFILGKSSSK